MKKIMFFNIPAHGHTNPTLEVVRELTALGHQIRYYSFPEFKSSIEASGAEYVEAKCTFLPDKSGKAVGRNFPKFMEVLLDATGQLSEPVSEDIRKFQPDAIVCDFNCLWGKLFARRFDIPLISSNTAFAFSKETARMMKTGFKEMFYMVTGMGRVKKQTARLQALGFPLDDAFTLLQDTEDTPSIVFTSRAFQPMGESFGPHVHFVGPSLRQTEIIVNTSDKPIIYISLGTVNNENIDFYQNCIKAFSDMKADIIMSVGNSTDLSLLEQAPSHFKIEKSVNQLEVLQQADVFLTHSGMNSVNESLYFQTPMVFYPQTPEQVMVAERGIELNTGIRLQKNTPAAIRMSVEEVLGNSRYQQQTVVISKSLREAGGAKKAAQVILDNC